jgi:hypothetical protein
MFNKMKYITRMLMVVSTITCALWVSPSISSELAKGVARTPTGFDKNYFYISSSPFNSVDGTFLVDGIVNGDGMNFQKNVMGRNDQEMMENKQAAIDFFMERFGVDVNDSNVYFTGFEVMPEIQYRAVVSTDEAVPAAGWPVHDGGWIVVVMNPDGIELGGEYVGRKAPPMTMFVFGNYKIDRMKYREHDSEHMKKSPVIISYKSTKPIVPESDGSFAVSCELFSEEFGPGQAIGATLPKILPDGRMIMNTRNSLTFPPFGNEVP